jgi:hypothetical protein
MPGTNVAPVVDVAVHVVGETASVHRYHSTPAVRLPDPGADRHAAVAPVRVSPTSATPAMAGLVRASGGATTGSPMSPAPPNQGEASWDASSAAASWSLSMR